jgi:hypothetical protein
MMFVEFEDYGDGSKVPIAADGGEGVAVYGSKGVVFRFGFRD